MQGVWLQCDVLQRNVGIKFINIEFVCLLPLDHPVVTVPLHPTFQSIVGFLLIASAWFKFSCKIVYTSVLSASMAPVFFGFFSIPSLFLEVIVSSCEGGMLLVVAGGVSTPHPTNSQPRWLRKVISQVSVIPVSSGPAQELPFWSSPQSKGGFLSEIHSLNHIHSAVTNLQRHKSFNQMVKCEM